MIEAIKTKLTPSVPALPPVMNQPLPDYAVLYFEHLAGEYDSLPVSKLELEAKSIVEGILKKSQTQALTWRDMYTFDLILTRGLPVERLNRKAWNLRSRYRDVAGLKEYEAYLASKPPDLAAATKEEELRADIEYLMSEIYLRYAILPVRERVRDQITNKVLYMHAYSDCLDHRFSLQRVEAFLRGVDSLGNGNCDARHFQWSGRRLGQHATALSERFK